MKTSRTCGVLCVLFAVAVVSIAFADATADRSNMQIFMRQKLEFSKGITEGIVLEKFEVISLNAAALRKMTQTNFWIQTQNTNYLAKMTNFQTQLGTLFLPRAIAISTAPPKPTAMFSKAVSIATTSCAKNKLASRVGVVATNSAVIYKPLHLMGAHCSLH